MSVHTSGESGDFQWKIQRFNWFQYGDSRFKEEEYDDDTKIVYERILAWTTEGAYEVFGNMYR